MTSEYSGIPLMPSVARQIIEELFQTQHQWKRDALAAAVQRVHTSRGGTRGRQNSIAVVQRALYDLEADGRVVNVQYGHWRWASPHVTAIDSPRDAALDAPTDEGEENVINSIIEREIGSGPESVYLYFNPNDRVLAEHTGRIVWECKIGRTGVSETVYRILSQGAKTALSHPPIVGLVIRTHDSYALERALHAALRLVDAQVTDSPGVEWFMTSPQHVEAWYMHFAQALTQLQRG